MRKATCLTLIALGAILAFAVKGHPSFLNIQVVGWVIMATGAVGMVMPDSSYAALRRRIIRRRYGPSGQITESDEIVYPPYVHVNPASLAPGSDDPADLVSSRAENQAERTEFTDDYDNT